MMSFIFNQRQNITKATDESNFSYFLFKMGSSNSTQTTSSKTTSSFSSSLTESDKNTNITLTPNFNQSIKTEDNATTTVTPLDIKNNNNNNISNNNSGLNKNNQNFVLPTLSINQTHTTRYSGDLPINSNILSVSNNNNNKTLNETDSEVNQNSTSVLTNTPVTIGSKNSIGASNSFSLMKQINNSKDIRNKLNDFRAVLDSEYSQLKLNIESPYGGSSSISTIENTDTSNSITINKINPARPSFLTPLNLPSLHTDKQNYSMTPKNRREDLKPFDFRTGVLGSEPTVLRPNKLASLDNNNTKSAVNLPIDNSNNLNLDNGKFSKSSNVLYPLNFPSRSSSSSSVSSSSSPMYPPSNQLSHSAKCRLEAANSNKFKEIMRNTGYLLIDGNRVKTSMDDLNSICELGSGTCGHVIKMKHSPTGYSMAVKQMSISGIVEENKRIIMDLDVVLKSHDCSDIVRCLGYFISESDVWICMELMSMCFDKLLKLIKNPIPEAILGKLTVSTLNALNYLKEKHNVIHRDIKPSNILIDENGEIKLCDFGISGNLINSNAKSRNNAGCAGYMAPERIDPVDPQNPVYDIRADVWSLGITLVELATGKYPYRHCHNEFEVMSTILETDAPKLEGDEFSDDFKSFISMCLVKDVKKRPKYNVLLQHPFVVHHKKEDVDIKSWFRKMTNKQTSSEENLTPVLDSAEQVESSRTPTENNQIIDSTQIVEFK